MCVCLYVYVLPCKLSPLYVCFFIKRTFHLKSTVEKNETEHKYSEYEGKMHYGFNMIIDRMLIFFILMNELNACQPKNV